MLTRIHPSYQAQPIRPTLGVLERVGAHRSKHWLAGGYDASMPLVPLTRILWQNCRVIVAKRDSKGNLLNSEGGFFALQKHMMRSDAWKSLTPQEVAVFIRVAFRFKGDNNGRLAISCLLYTSPSPRDRQKSRMPSSA